ncbi:MAG: homoserine dehydrogenase [Planctomycetes bacterium]|nr:homoserine dehydrogenase [Planctomycetota bacterium]
MTRTTSTSELFHIAVQNRAKGLGKRFSRPRTVRVGLLGLGTVGQGLCRLLQENKPAPGRSQDVDFQITTVLMRRLSHPRNVVPAHADLIRDPELFLAGNYDLVVECMGGLEPAGSIITAFLKRGIPVVTANKALLAERGEALRDLARSNRTTLRYEASVAAGIPILSLCGYALRSFRVDRVNAILNGTSNAILTAMDQEGLTLARALKKAQEQGFAEADPHMDLSGIDAAQKLSLLLHALGVNLALGSIETTGLERIEPGDCRLARAFGHILKPVASACLTSAKPGGFVAPVLVPENHPLAGVSEADNGIHLSGDPLGTLFLSGPGAGGLPTAASLLDDMIATATGFPATHWTGHRRAGTPYTPPGGFLPAEGSDMRESRYFSSWFLSLIGRGGPVRTDDLLEYLTASGTIFRELRVFRDGEARTIAGITTPTSEAMVRKLETGLNSAGLLKRFRAFRVIGNPQEEDLS